MDTLILAVHIAAGSMAILAGAVAVYAAKGAGLHRRSGMLFVYAMIIMGMSGMVVAITRDIAGSVTGGPTAAYFVITALTTVRPISRRLDIGMVAAAMAITLVTMALVIDALAAGRFTIDGVPVPMKMMFATILLFAALADVRVLREGISGSRRIARHLWRMCFAFWVATGSFFLGQMDEFPVWLQQPALMAVLAFAPLFVMVYWLWRVRLRRLTAGLTLRGSATRGALRLSQQPLPPGAAPCEAPAPPRSCPPSSTRSDLTFPHSAR